MVVVTDGSPLRDWLAGRTADQLATILEFRPQTLWGAPLRGLGDLAARLVQPASVGAAVAELPLPGLELLHALTAAEKAPGSTAQVRRPRPFRSGIIAIATTGAASPSRHPNNLPAARQHALEFFAPPSR